MTGRYREPGGMAKWSPGREQPWRSEPEGMAQSLELERRRKCLECDWRNTGGMVDQSPRRETAMEERAGGNGSESGAGAQLEGA
jgi:hypothetical protein